MEMFWLSYHMWSKMIVSIDWIVTSIKGFKHDSRSLFSCGSSLALILMVLSIWTHRQFGRGGLQHSSDLTEKLDWSGMCIHMVVQHRGSRNNSTRIQQAKGIHTRGWGHEYIGRDTALSLKAELHVPYLVKRHGVKPPWSPPVSWKVESSILFGGLTVVVAQW